MLSTAVDLFGDLVNLVIMITNQLTHMLSSAAA
jgi:hypothetical protein